MNARSIDALKRKFRTVLTEEPNTRNSDKELTIRVWKRFYLGEKAEGITFDQLYDLPSEDQIKRVRARIQNDEQDLLPTDPEVAKKRRIYEEFWKSAMSAEFGPSYAGCYGSKYLSMSICDCLDAKRITAEEFAELAEESIDRVHKLVQGIERIDENLARKMSEILGGSVSFWINLQRIYTNLTKPLSYDDVSKN